MAYSVRFNDVAAKQFGRLDGSVQKRVAAFLSKIEAAPDPRALGAPLVGAWSGFWKFRRGDYRIIAGISDDELIVEVVKVGHRGAVYRGR